MNKRHVLPLFLAALLALGTACSRKEEPATQVITSAETALASVKQDATQYAPESLAAVEAKLASLKSGLAKKDYDAVIAAGPDLNSSITQLQGEVATKRQQAQADAEAWTGLAADVPQMIAAIQSRVDSLDKSRRLPRGMDKAAFQAVKDGLAQMKSDWNNATTAHDMDNPTGAAAAARSAQEKGRELLAQLGMQPAPAG